MNQLPSAKSSSSKEWLIAISVFVIFGGMCGFLGVFKGKLGRSSFFSTSSGSTSDTAASSPSTKVYVKAPKKASASSKESSASSASEEAPQVEISRVRIVPFVNSQGRKLQMVMIDWKNTGALPIAALHVSLDLYDEKGQLMKEESLASECIFTAKRQGQAIKPGDAYEEPIGEGIVVLSPTGNSARRAEVEIVRVDAQVASN